MQVWAVVLIVLGALILIWATIGLVGCLISLRKNSLAGKIINKQFRKQYALYKIDVEWWDKFDAEEIQVEANKQKLKGFLIKNNSNKIAICVHGIFGVHQDLAPQAKIFYDAGFNIFAPDLRAHGKSSGKFIGMGFFEKNDLILWINKLVQIFGENCEIVLCGISMGGATVLLCAGENLPKNVKAVVSDSAYSNAYEEIKFLIQKRGHFPWFLILPQMNFFFKVFGKFNLKQVNPKLAVEKTRLPILFFHGKNDKFVPFHFSKEMFEVSNKNQCQLVLTNAKHIQSYALNEKDYAKTLLEFVNRLT